MNSFKIDQFKSCLDGLYYYNSFDTLQEFWEKCNRGDWMLWLADRLKLDKKAVILVKGYCAKTIYHLMKDQRSKDAVDAVIAFGKGEISKEKLYAAYAAAAAAYAAYAAAAAAYAAAAAAAAADADAYAAAAAADAAAAAAAAAADAAYAAADADAYAAADAAAAAAAAARIKNRQETADICRKYLTKEIESYFLS